MIGEDTIQMLESITKKSKHVKLVDLFELDMDDAAPQNLLKRMTQLGVVIQIIKLKWGGVCGKCNHIL